MSDEIAVAASPGTAWKEVPAAVVAAARGAELRESEKAIRHWGLKVAQFGSPPPLMAFDLTQMLKGDWSYRFLIAADAVVENHAFLIYGPRFARLLGLPEQPLVQIPMMPQLPERYRIVFARGCGEAVEAGSPVRINGMFQCDDGRREVYRAAFMPVAVRPNSLTQLVFGAFNCRMIRRMERPPGSPEAPSPA